MCFKNSTLLQKLDQILHCVSPFLQRYASHTVVRDTAARIIYCFYWDLRNKVVFNAPAICVSKITKPKSSRRGRTCCLPECNTWQCLLHGTEGCYKRLTKLQPIYIFEIL